MTDWAHGWMLCCLASGLQRPPSAAALAESGWARAESQCRSPFPLSRPKITFLNCRFGKGYTNATVLAAYINTILITCFHFCTYLLKPLNMNAVLGRQDVRNDRQVDSAIGSGILGFPSFQNINQCFSKFSFLPDYLLISTFMPTASRFMFGCVQAAAGFNPITDQFAAAVSWLLESSRQVDWDVGIQPEIF